MKLPKSVHNHGSISMTYGQYSNNFPQGHKRRNIPKYAKGYLLKDDKEEYYWVTLDEYNNDGRKIYGKHWINMEDR